MNFEQFVVGEHVRQGHKFFVGRGFGYQRNEQGVPVYRPHVDRVMIAESAFIGNGTNIDIGRDRDTTIDDYTVIDSLVHIGHSAKIGKKCIIVSGAVIGGHAEIGDGSYIGPNAFIKQGIKIGKACFVGPLCNIHKDLPDKTVIVSSPSVLRKDMEDNEYVKRSVHFE